jgi:hypothetical protein
MISGFSANRIPLLAAGCGGPQSTVRTNANATRSSITFG